MKKRARTIVGALGFLLALSIPSHAQELEYQQVWVAGGGEARLELRADFLPDFGLEVVDDGRAVHRVVEHRELLSSDDHLVLEAPYGNFERFLSGRLTLDTGWVLRYRGREVRLDGLTLTPGIYRNGHPSLEARDEAGRHLLTLTHLHILAEPERGMLIVHNADIVATTGLSDRLGVKALAGMPIGMAWFDLPLQIPAGADVSGLGPGCENRPLWPQEGEPVDVGLIGMGNIAYQGTDPETGKVKVAPSATLKNMSNGDVPWIPKFDGHPEYPYEPGDQHPFLVWNMYRIVDGRIEQLADSGVKHAFLTLNNNCDINCGDGHILWPGCEDVYSSGTNDSNSALGPRGDIEASEGLFFSTCSFFDPGCSGQQTNNSEEYENRLLVDPDDLQTPGAEYFFDSWYVIQYDTDIWNSMGYHPITPAPVGDGWTFNPGPFTVGQVLDEWVSPDDPGPNAEHVSVTVPSATPDEPYPGNMPQGHIDVAVRVTEPEAGIFRYNYAVQNFDFDRGVEAFRIPIPAGAQVSQTFFQDIDDDAGNDWTVTVDGGFVNFEMTTDHPLPWFTLFNFEIEVDAPPAASQVTLDLGGDAVVPSIDAAILGPSTGGGETHVVTVQNFEFVPAELTINVGDTVVWDSVEGTHNVLADDGSFTSGPPAPAPWTFSFTFDEAGANPYFCEPHGGPGGQGMSGVINVVGGPAPELSFDPGSLAFGDVEVGTTSPPQIATLSNTGDADATALTFSGLPDAGFAADTSGCGDTLPAGASCEVSVAFTPQAPGAAAATLHVASDEGAAADLELSGNGVAGPAPTFPEIELEEFISGLTMPVSVSNAGDGTDRLFVVQQTGEILIVSDGELLPTPFLDLSALVSCCGERGLLGLAFHPDYVTSGFFYVDYTDLDGNTVVARYSVSADDPNVADPDSAQVVLTQAQPFSNHNGGNLVFGPDGYLYIGLGDGGSGGDPQDNGQDIETWLGKILRVDVDGDAFPDDPDRNYAVPPDNPFVGEPGLDEIWAYGVRNPWRFTFDRDTGDLWIGDVGQGSWEEIDLQPAASAGGENYGWDVLEAAHCFEDDPPGSCDDFLNGGSDLPIIEYDHSQGCSVTGGYRYRGQLQPPLTGVYFYADLCSGLIWGALPAGDGTWASEQLLQAPFSITTFGEDEGGELYVAEYASAAGESKLHRVVVPGAGAPVLSFDPATLDFGEVLVGTTSPPQTTTLSNTGDADATALAFSILPEAGFAADTSACGDTLPAGGSCAVSVTFSPLAPGPVTATLSVESAEGAGASMGLSGTGVASQGPVADISPDSFAFTLEEGETGTEILSIGNVGDLDLEWSITTDVPQAMTGPSVLDHDPALDEPIDFPEFVLDSLPNGGKPISFTMPGGVLTEGEVVGFHFIGTVSGINDTTSWASDMCMTIEAPDGTTYVVGGFTGTSQPDCYNGIDGNPWDFQGIQSDDDGTYESEHDNVFDPALEDDGDWTFTFSNDWKSPDASTMTWTDVTITLHKTAGAPSLCDDVTEVPWLAADPDAGTTAPGTVEQVTVTADAAAAGPGTHEAALCVATNDPAAPVVPVPVSLTVVEVGEPVLSFDPASLDFGDVPVGETSAPQTSMLSNTGDGDATGATFSGLPANGFAADTSACGATLPAGESCAVSVTFTPAAPGPATATLHVDSDEGAAADLGLAGNGVGGGDPPVIDVDPDSLASTLPEGGTETQPLTIANLGDETLEWEVTEDGAAGARPVRIAARRSSAAADGARARRTSRTVMTVNEEGVFEATGVAGPAGDAATSFAPAPIARSGGPAHILPLGTTLWSYDDEEAIADGVAVDATNVWGSWTLNGARLSAHPILGDGTPAVEFSSFDSGNSGVVAAQGADRIAFMESNAAGNDFWVHAFTSTSGNTPDWSFQFPVSDPNLPASSKKLAVSHDGSTIAAVVSDSVTLESTLYVFDAATGEVTLTWTDDLRMDGVDLTDDGSIALVAETNLATVLDTATGDVLFQVAGSGAGNVSYRISGDGSVFIVDGFDFDVYRHDGTTYQQIIHFTQPSSWFGGASAVSRDGSTVGTFAGNFAASWLEGEVYLFDVASGELIGSHPVSGSGQFQGSPSDAAASDDGSVFAFASWGTEFEDWPEVMVFNRDVELIGEIAFPGSAFSVDVSPDGQYVVGGAKAVHANEFGSGGRIELAEIEGGEPTDCVLPTWVGVSPTSGTVPGGGSQVADVTFDATGLDPGDYTANLCLASNDPVTPLVVVPLSLTVMEGGEPILAFDPSSLDFGDVLVGETSEPQTSTLSNTGDADATAVTFSGLPANGFEADTSACGDTLPAGGSCAVSVTFTPAVAGPAIATLHVASAEGAAADLGLSGNGIEPQGPIADISPDSFAFEVPQGGGDSDTLNIGNLGGTDLTWSIDEAEAIAVPEGAPYRYGLAETPTFNAPVGSSRATAVLKRPASVPADPVVLPAPQPMAIGSLTEGFDDITQLPGAGWALINNSEPVGPSSWFQGNETIFPAHEGDPNAYIAANYESTDGLGTISNWLITPEVTIVNGTTLTFWTRKSELFEQFADRMEVRMSVEGASTDVGDTAESVGDFVTLLLTINPELVPGEYPQEWTSFTVTVRERSREPVTGRFAFRYWVTDSGPEGTNGDYIGIDTVSVTQPDDVPTPVGCDNPADIPWLSADPTSGTTPPAGTVPVNVTVDATDLETGEHTAQLCVTTNDPNAPLVEVPIVLTVTGGGAHFCDAVTSIPDPECRALVAMYETNGGEGWNLPGWLEDLDPCTWEGVVCELRDDQNHVTRLQFLFTPFTGDLAPEVGDLAYLEILQILFNGGLTGLPDEIGNLAHLQRLAVEFGQLSELPPTVGQLTALTSLELSNNQLTSLPDELGSLTSLEHIQAVSNQLTALPDSLGALGSLETLLVQWNQIPELPAGFSNLQSLRTLDLSGNPLGGELPLAITELGALEILIVTDAGLTGVPDSISQLQNLIELQLYFNEIDVLPAAIAELGALELLGMSGNLISEIPDWVGDLPSLRFLYLGDNLLTELPATLAGLDQTEVFDTGGNQISGEIPAWLGTFSEMYTLILWNNDFSGEVPIGLRDGTSIGGDFSQFELSGNGCLTSTVDPTFTAWLDEHAPGWDDGCVEEGSDDQSDGPTSAPAAPMEF